jgi:hypothetical protein
MDGSVTLGEQRIMRVRPLRVVLDDLVFAARARAARAKKNPPALHSYNNYFLPSRPTNFGV